MCLYIGDNNIMKKILIITAVILLNLNLTTFAVCQLSSLESCKADMQPSNFNKGIKEKMLPNRLDDIKTPNSTFNNRTNQGQSHTPDNINMEPIQKEDTQPYNANCQFGNCMNRTNQGENNKN